MGKIKQPTIGVIGLKGLPAHGGAATVGENIIKNLNEHYTFFVYATSTHTTGKFEEKNIKQVVFKKFPINQLNTLYYYFVSVLHALFIANYDLIHIHHSDSGLFVPLLKLKYKVIGTTHGRGQFNDKWGAGTRIFLNISEKLFLKFVDIVVSVSKVDANVYKELTHSDVFYIPNGINEIQDEYSINSSGNSQHAVFAAGRIIPLKGCDLILQAFKKGGIRDTITIIGDMGQTSSHATELTKLAEGLNVEFKGLIKGKELLFEEIKKASVFIFPSRMEAMSMMLLEVVSLGVPVICSDIEANRAIFNSDEVVFFKSGSVDDLLEKYLWATENYEELLRRASRSKEKLQAHYNWGKIAFQYSKLYDNYVKI